MGLGLAILGASALSGLFSSRSASKAAKAQTQASKSGIGEQQRQFDRVVELLKPYSDAGVGALNAQKDLIGLNGGEAGSAAMDALINSPQYKALVQQGEEGILQNASATGGLRGGNIQGALAQFRPQLLAQLIESQFQKLGTITNTGQASAAGQGAAAQQTGNNISNLFGEIGQAGAGKAIAQGQAFSNIANTLPTLAVMKQAKVF